MKNLSGSFLRGKQEKEAFKIVRAYVEELNDCVEQEHYIKQE